MSASILAAISRLPQLTGTLRHAAQRLAYFADGTGTLQRSYDYLAQDRHVHISTAKRLIARLIDAKIIEKQVVRLSPTRCARNVYRFTKWVMALVPKRSSSRMRQDQAPQEREKDAWREQQRRDPGYLDRLRRMVATMLPGAPPSEGVQAEIALMEARGAP